MDINWLSSLWAKNADRKPAASDDPPAFGNNRHELMFDSLMDVPAENASTGGTYAPLSSVEATLQRPRLERDFV